MIRKGRKKVKEEFKTQGEHSIDKEIACRDESHTHNNSLKEEAKPLFCK